MNKWMKREVKKKVREKNKGREKEAMEEKVGREETWREGGKEEKVEENNVKKI